MTQRPARAHPRAVLLVAMLLIALSCGFSAFSPWFLPARILEGPMVQQAGEDAVTLTWFTSRPLASGDCHVDVSVGPESRVIAAVAHGKRQDARVSGLMAGHVYPYSIRLGTRTLASGALHTNKPPGQPFAFLVFGDSGIGGRAQYELAGQMLALPVPPDFILHTGDVIYERGQRSDFKDRFFVPYRHLLANVPFWPTLGNHDVAKPDAGRPYLDVFDLPENGPAGLPAERHYWFDYASARIAAVDSNTDEVTLATHVAPWLRSALAGAPACWKFVILHHPPYTGGKYKPNLTIQRTLVPVFDEAGVDIVFSGHDHMYQRTHALRGGEIAPDGAGVVYIISGAGGNRLYEPLPPSRRPAYVAALHNERHSFTFVRVEDNRLTLRQIDLHGSVLDEWTLTKTSPPPVTQPIPTETP